MMRLKKTTNKGKVVPVTGVNQTAGPGVVALVEYPSYLSDHLLRSVHSP